MSDLCGFFLCEVGFATDIDVSDSGYPGRRSGLGDSVLPCRASRFAPSKRLPTFFRPTTTIGHCVVIAPRTANGLQDRLRFAISVRVPPRSCSTRTSYAFLQGVDLREVTYRCSPKSGYAVGIKCGINTDDRNLLGDRLCDDQTVKRVVMVLFHCR